MLRLDPESAVAPFEQVRRQLAAQIESGELVPGSRLPTVRRLAGDLGVAPNTIARTYRELEAAGLVVTAGRNGTLVADRGLEAGTDAAASEVTTEFVARMRAFGLGTPAIEAHVRRALGAAP